VAGVVDFLERTPAAVGVQRFTADATGDLLVAPAWCRGKSGILAAILEEFRKRGTRQGVAAETLPIQADIHADIPAGIRTGLHA